MKKEFIPRQISADIYRLFSSYPVVTLTGPRQSGKTTLCKMLLPELPYYSCEDLKTREMLSSDPASLLGAHTEGIILDEVHRVPQLFSYIQVKVDALGKNRLFLLTGSAQFEMLSSGSQSLAGRTALARLLPLSLTELLEARTANISVEHLIYRGFYPRLYAEDINPTEAMGFYTNTYLERDVRNLLAVKDLNRFELFLKLLAGRTGQVFNAANLSSDSGIDPTTIKSWLSVLQASYVVFLLQPYYGQSAKRILKSPKTFFYDVGLASYLIGLRQVSEVRLHPLFGSLFETMVISELVKNCYNHIKEPNFYFYRDRSGNEIDLIIDYGVSRPHVPVEIKASSTFTESLLDGLKKYLRLAQGKAVKPVLIYAGEESFTYKGFNVVSFRNIATVADLADAAQ